MFALNSTVASNIDHIYLAFIIYDAFLCSLISNMKVFYTFLSAAENLDKITRFKGKYANRRSKFAAPECCCLNLPRVAQARLYCWSAD